MVDLLIIATHGLENPTQASFSFFVARAAVSTGKKTALVLAADSSSVAVAEIRSNIKGVGLPALEELYQELRRSEVPIYI